MNTPTSSSLGKIEAVRQLAASIVRYARGDAWTAVFLMIMAALLEGVGLVLLIPILGVIVSGPLDNVAGDALNWLGVTNSSMQLLILVGVFVTAAVIRAQVLHMRDVKISNIQLGFARAERIEIVDRLARSGWSRLVTLSHARVQSLINHEISRSVTTAQCLIKIMVALLMVTVNLMIAVWLAPTLVLLLLLLLAMCSLFLRFAQRDAFELGSEVRGSARDMMSSTQNLLSGLKTALAQETQTWFTDEFARVQDRVLGSQQAFVVQQSNARRVFAGASALIASAIVLGGYWLKVEPASLIIVVMTLSRLAGPALQLQQNVQQFLFGFPSVYAVIEIRGQLPAPVFRSSDPVTVFEGDLTLEDVTYRHPGGGGAGPLSLTVRQGEFLGIEGPSGAGKSTLVDIMAGLLKPQTGRLLVGDQPLDEASYAGWRCHLSYVGQQAYLFNDKLRANLSWTEQSLTDDEIWNAVGLVGMTDLVRGLENGLDTQLGEAGAVLSGGERQRIALARSLLRRPRFLILDEATSAIDIASEREFFNRLEGMEFRPTIISVAHRAETLAHCTRVIAMEAGRIVHTDNR